MSQKYKIPLRYASLQEKLILYFLLLGILAIGVVSVISFVSTREALLNRTFDQLTSLRVVKTNQINQFYQDRIRDILFVGKECSGRWDIVTTASGKEGSIRQAGRLLSSSDTLLGRYFTGFYLLDGDSVLAAGSLRDDNSLAQSILPRNQVDLLLLQLRSQQVGLTDLFSDTAGGEPRQLIALRPGEGAASGTGERLTLILALSVDAINAIMLNDDPLAGLGLSGETYLVGADSLMRSTSRFLPASILKTRVATGAVNGAFSEGKGVIITRDYRDIPVLSSFGRVAVPGLNWVILAEIDVSEAMVPIFETRTRILLLSVIIILVFFGLVFMIARRITKPLDRLKVAVKELGEGKYDVELPVTTRDEIGALTDSFNIMARQIKEKTTELQVERFGRMRSVIDGEEMERQRLSRELHDGIGQLLIAIKLRLESLLYQEGKDIKTSIQELKRYFDQIIDEVRRISNNLMPSVLEAFGLVIAFRNLFSETEEHTGLKIHFEARGDFDNIDRKVMTYIYRLSQEALSNIVKHAEAGEVWIKLGRQADNLTLEIRDNGRGFNPATAGKEGGNGIHNMRERASILQGTISIQSAPGKGTTISVNVPIFIPYVPNQDFPRG